MPGSSQDTFASRTPLRIRDVGLVVRDAETVGRYYLDLLGLETLDAGEDVHRIGVGDITLLTLIERPDALPDDSSEAGLFHAAFLMPRRADLAHWVKRAAREGRTVDGASDHLVSEAIYLHDPEGNGIEIYADRPSSAWQWQDGALRMATEPLDIAALTKAADGLDADYERAPEGLRIGHVHLRVGDTEEAERFYAGALGLDVTTHYPGAAFLSSGGYHHHIAGNVWSSRGAGTRDPKRAGLAWVTVEAADEAVRAATVERLESAGAAMRDVAVGTAAVADPWGTEIRLVAAAG